MFTLINPSGPDFIKDFPGINATNLDAIDEYARACLTTHPLKFYNPIFKADSTDPTLGTGGFTKGYWYEIWDQIYTWGEVRFGTAGINAGNGMYYVTLPVAANNLLGSTNTPGTAPIVGSGSTYDDSSNAGRLPITVHLRNSTEIFFGLKMNSGFAFRELRETGYVTWAINDGFSWFARYQRAV